MKINILLMIGEFTSGGAESMVINLANCLDKRIFNVIVHARANGPLSTNLNPEVRKIIIRKNNVIDMSYFKKLIHAIKENKIDIIHSHLFGNNLYGFLAGKLTGRKIIQTVHGMDCLSTKKRILMYRSMIPFVNKIVFVSPILKDEFLKRTKTNLRRFSVIYNGINLDEANPGSMRQYKELLRIGDFDHIVGAVGNIKHVKGYDILVKAAKIVVGHYPQAKFLIVGEIFDKDRVIRRNLDELMNNLDLLNNVHFLGFRNDVKNLLPLFDIYVLPSRSEGLSIALLEAMGAQRPVVATRVGGNSILVRDGISGLLVPPEDPYALSSAIVHLLRNEQLRLKFGKEARRIVETKFSIETMTNKYSQLYLSFLRNLNRA